MPTPIWLDTDIGSNVDDLLALLFIAGSPELELVGISTVYGNTDLRARIADKVVDLLGLEIPVVPGIGEPRSQEPIFWTGHEGHNYGPLPRLTTKADWRDVLAHAATTYAGELVIGGIGPLTNLADVVARPWGENVAKFVVMGGRFDGGEPDRNVGSDAVSAQRFVDQRRVPVDFVGIEVCRRVWLADADLERMTARGHAELRDLVATEVETWWQFKGERRSNPCDPLTLLSVVRPDLFDFAHASVTFTAEGGARDGTTILETSGAEVVGVGSPRYVVGVDIERARAEIVRRVAAAINGAGMG